VKLLTLKTILVATDLNEGSRAALATARELAESAGAAVHVVYVSDDPAADEHLAARLGELGFPVEDASAHVVKGDPASAINTLGDEIGADAILVGPHRARHEGQGSDVLGSTALALVTNASVPCLVVTSQLRIPLQCAVAAVDISDTARGTLAVALSWTSALRAQRVDAEPSTVLTMLHVDRSATQRSELEEMLEYVRREAGSWAGATIESAQIENADAASGIAGYATTHRADMVVLGTRGLAVESAGRVGSVALAVIKTLEVPVLLVPPAMWAAPANHFA
jgi:nucleotide-binding universal stress UspA family protein